MTISPSRTKRCALSDARASTSSGKYRVRGFCAFDIKSTRLPSRKARQRNPSHLGSYCHCGPEGRSAAGKASIGGEVFLIGRLIEIQARMGVNTLLRCIYADDS